MAFNFFKSNAFRSLATLLGITMICGGGLSVANNFLKVTDEEKELRAYSKILDGGEKVVDNKILAEALPLADGTIDQVCLTDQGNYLVKSTGNGGFKGGTVTVWVLLNVENNALAGIGKVQYEANDSQSYIGIATGDKYFLPSFTQHNEEIVAGSVFSVVEEEDCIQTVAAGATRSSTAIVNAVNTAVEYANVYLFGNGGGSDTDTPSDGASTLAYAKYLKSVTATVSRKTVTYSIEVKEMDNAKNFVVDVTVKDGAITAYEIKTNGSTSGYDAKMADVASLVNGKTFDEIKALIGSETEADVSKMDNTLHTGATFSNLIALTAAAYATENYSWFVTNGSYTTYMKSVTATVSRKTVTYSIEVKGMDNAGNFVIETAVKDGAISSFAIKTNGSTSDAYASKMADVEALVTGKTFEDIKALIGSETEASVDKMDNSLHTGASFSNLMCLTAAAYATANYAAFIG